MQCSPRMLCVERIALLCAVPRAGARFGFGRIVLGRIVLADLCSAELCSDLGLVKWCRLSSRLLFDAIRSLCMGVRYYKAQPPRMHVRSSSKCFGDDKHACRRKQNWLDLPT